MLVISKQMQIKEKNIGERYCSLPDKINMAFTSEASRWTNLRKFMLINSLNVSLKCVSFK